MSTNSESVLLETVHGVRQRVPLAELRERHDRKHQGPADQDPSEPTPRDRSVSP